MTETAIAEQKAFQEAIKDRLRSSIGELMPDAVLAQLIEKGVEELFFKKVRNEDRYGHVTQESSWFEKELKTLLDAKVREVLNGYLEKNHDRLAQMIEKELVAKAPQLLSELLMTAVISSGNNLGWMLKEALQRRGVLIA